MHQKVFFFLIYFAILYNQLINAKTLVGPNVRRIEPNEFPSVVCIIKNGPEQDLNDIVFCTGVLISNSHILTAAHCIDYIRGIGFKLLIGSHDLTNSLTHHPFWWIAYNNWIVAQNRELTPENDIAIIKLQVFAMNVVINQISTIMPHSLLYGHEADMVGCGKGNNGRVSRIMKTVKVRILPHSQCDYIISHLEGKEIHLPEKYFCSVGNPYAFPGPADSGGPLFLYGVTTAINVGDCPDLQGEFHPEKVNLHVGVAYYKEFTDSVLAY